MAVVILKNGREDEVQMFMLGCCSDGNLGTEQSADPSFLDVTFESTSPGATQPCVSLQQLVADGNCLVSINGLTAGDCLLLPTAGGGTTCVPMSVVGGVAVQVASSDPVFTTLVGVAMDVTLCNGNGYWTRGPGNAQINMPGPVLLYHELVGHGRHICNGTVNSANPEGQAIGEENVLRGVLGEPQRTAHEGGCGGGGGGGGCYIATAAYGSPIAPEVHELRLFRDRVLRATRWGSDLFDEFYKYYYTVSPVLAARMRDDPRLAEVVRAILVQPLVLGLRLFVLLPADPDDPEQAARFARRASEEFAAWVRRLPLAPSAPADPLEAGADLLAGLAVSANSRVRDALLQNLLEAGVLPLELPEHDREQLQAGLRECGLSSVQIEAILHTEENHD